MSPSLWERRRDFGVAKAKEQKIQAREIFVKVQGKRWVVFFVKLPYWILAIRLRSEGPDCRSTGVHGMC